jgi:hypothetical protein
MEEFAMMNMNNAAADTTRTLLHKWIDLLEESSLPEVEWLLKGYVARDLNRSYREGQKQK